MKLSCVSSLICFFYFLQQDNYYKLFMFNVYLANWTTWSNWGSCNATCGIVSCTRNRTCSNPPPFSPDYIGCLKMNNDTGFNETAVRYQFSDCPGKFQL